jgi:hypothetical protein
MYITPTSLKTMNWSEPLPKSCPPVSATSYPNNIFFRLAENSPPIEYDFQSHRMRYPERRFHVDECQACSLSVFNNEDSVLALKKLPSFKRKSVFVLKLALKESDGVLLQTSQDVHHYSWWRSKSFLFSALV